MVYKSIFGVKPKKENKKQFCKRVVSLLNGIGYVSNGYIYHDGLFMINDIFKYSDLNNGYVDVDDMLKECNPSYKNIFKLANDFVVITEEEILINTDIIFNCLYSFKGDHNRYFDDRDDALKTINILVTAIKEYLLTCGYKLSLNEEENRFYIMDNDIAVDVSEINDLRLKNDIMNYYDYRNAKDKEEKKRIIVALCDKLESRKIDISSKFGSKINDMIGSYVNNVQLRHDNSNEKNKSKYKKKVACLSDEQLIRWYDYIFSFLLNVYINLDRVDEINVDGGYI